MAKVMSPFHHPSPLLAVQGLGTPSSAVSSATASPAFTVPTARPSTWSTPTPSSSSHSRRLSSTPSTPSASAGSKAPASPSDLSAGPSRSGVARPALSSSRRGLDLRPDERDGYGTPSPSVSPMLTATRVREDDISSPATPASYVTPLSSPPIHPGSVQSASMTDFSLSARASSQGGPARSRRGSRNMLDDPALAEEGGDVHEHGSGSGSGSRTWRRRSSLTRVLADVSKRLTGESVTTSSSNSSGPTARREGAPKGKNRGRPPSAAVTGSPSRKTAGSTKPTGLLVQTLAPGRTDDADEDEDEDPLTFVPAKRNSSLPPGATAVTPKTSAERRSRRASKIAAEVPSPALASRTTSLPSFRDESEPTTPVAPPYKDSRTPFGIKFPIVPLVWPASARVPRSGSEQEILSSSAVSSSSSGHMTSSAEVHPRSNGLVGASPDASFERSFYTMSEASQSAPSIVSPPVSSQDADRPEWAWPEAGPTASSSAAASDAESTPSIPAAAAQSGAAFLAASSTRAHNRSLSSGAAEEVRKSQSKETSRLERRWQALLEIHDTERAYLRDLRVLVYVYLDAVDRAPFVGSPEKAVARRNVDQVLELGERMGRRMQLAVGAKLEAWRPFGTKRDEDEVDKVIERVAKAFISESPIFTVYEDFCSRHPEAASFLRSLELTPEWATFSKEPSPDNQSAYADEAHATAARSRLRLQDFAFKPVQRVTRYPMVLTNLLKYMGGERSAQEAKAREKVYQAVLAMKAVAESVDEAKRVREVEIKTDLIAGRMELHSSYRSAFVALLGQIQLVGSLHMLYHGPTLDPSEAFKIKYHGIFLYETHLVIVKVKRASVYEPRHWFPLRYFEVVDVPEGSGLMPFSFTLRYGQHAFELGATCEQEKQIWLASLRSTIESVNKMRAARVEADLPLNDDSIVSSINLEDSAPFGDAALLASPSSPGSTAPTSPIFGTMPLTDEPSPSVEGESPTATSGGTYPPTSNNGTTPRVSNRISRNVSTLLGRTPAVTQAAIDLKLTEVYSDSLLGCRAQAARELAAEAESSARRRTMSGSGGKRPSFGRSADKRKRMSYLEPSPSALGSSDDEHDEPPPMPELPASLDHVRNASAPQPSKPPVTRQRGALGVKSASAIDVPTLRQPTKVVSAESGEERPGTTAHGSASVERHGSSGSSSSASSGGPITPQPAYVDVAGVEIAANVESASPTLADNFLGVFTRRKGPLQRSAPGSTVDLTSSEEDATALDRGARSSSTSWLPGLKLARRMSRAGSARRSGRSTPSENLTPPSVPVPLPAQPLLQTAPITAPAPSLMATSISEPIPGRPASASLRPTQPHRAATQPLPSSFPVTAERAQRPELPRKKSLKAFLRMTPL